MMDTMSNDVLVKTNGLTKLYTMGETTVTALDGVSLNIKRGSFTVVMGPSGSGKSTLLYLLGGLDWPTSGAITVGNDEIEKMDENMLAEFRRNRVGFIFNPLTWSLPCRLRKMWASRCVSQGFPGQTAE